MRIGLDLHGLQAASCRGRGIGRYSDALLRALRSVAPDWEFVHYVRSDLPLDWERDQWSEWVETAPDDRVRPDGPLQRALRGNPRRLDWFVDPNPIIERVAHPFPDPVPGGPRLASVMHDLIPALFPRRYLWESGEANRYHRDLARLATRDLIAANSASTARDVRRLMGVPARRVVEIMAAGDSYFQPGDDPDDDRILNGLGIVGPFLYYLGNIDWRKNVLGLVDIYAGLRPETRRRFPLVITCGENPWFTPRLLERIEALGLTDRIILTGSLGDQSIRALYRRTSLFVFPSLYEGFGLPLLEAMRSGSPALAADNSSQPEVVGAAGCLARTDDPDDWADKIEALLADPDRLGAMRSASIEQAARFTWEGSAIRLRDALAAATRPTRRQAFDMALLPCPTAEPDGFSSDGVAIFDRIHREFRPLLFLDGRRLDALPPIGIDQAWSDARVASRVREAIDNPPLVHLIDDAQGWDEVLARLEVDPRASLIVIDRVEDLAAAVDRGRQDPSISVVIRSRSGRLARPSPGERIEEFNP